MNILFIPCIIHDDTNNGGVNYTVYLTLTIINIELVIND